MKYGSWVAGAASAAVLVGLALYVDASETGHTDGGAPGRHQSARCGRVAAGARRQPSRA
ncbi:hypothetical protein SGLAM104S_02780 [Streptomyces glaucescens]